jgi:phosphate transport system protein
MKKFDNELNALNAQLAAMGDLTKQMVRLACHAVKDRSRDVYDEALVMERKVDLMQLAIDKEAVRMLTVYSPVATDLRYLLVGMHVTSQLERIGDQVMNVCESLRMMRSAAVQHPTVETLERMATMVPEVVDEALDAYFSKDAEKAIATRTRDDVIDALNDQVMRDLLTDQVLKDVLSGAENIGEAVAQILISRQLERIADQATNICKEVVYMVRGDDVRHRHARGEL